MMLLEVTCGDGDVVEEAKAHGFVVFGVVSGWSKGAKGVLGVTGHDEVQSG